jgi:Flp pilus assembly protein TadB
MDEPVSIVVVFTVAALAVVCAASTVSGTIDALTRRRVRDRLGPRPHREPTRLHPWVATAHRKLTSPRRERAIDDGLAGWLDTAARAARSGATLRVALADGAVSVADQPVGRYVDSFVRRVSRGEPMEAALVALDSPATPSRTLVRRALLLAATTGGPAAPMLDAVAATLHERAALAREVRALATQARASAAVMVVAPGVFGVLASMVDPRVGAFLRSPAGVVCVGVGVVLDGAGAWWMTRVVRVAA